MTLSHSGASELALLMEGTTAGALIPEIVRRGFQDLMEAEASAAIGATRHEHCPDDHSNNRNGYRQRLLTTQVGDLSLAIPKLRQASFFSDWLEPRRRVDKALYAAVMEAYTGRYLHPEGRRPGGGAGRRQRDLQIGGEPHLRGPR